METAVRKTGLRRLDVILISLVIIAGIVRFTGMGLNSAVIHVNGGVMPAVGLLPGDFVQSPGGEVRRLESNETQKLLFLADRIEIPLSGVHLNWKPAQQVVEPLAVALQYPLDANTYYFSVGDILQFFGSVCALFILPILTVRIPLRIGSGDIPFRRYFS